MGWDSFGLPAENAAIREGGHPREIVERNIVEIRNQMKRHRLGDRLGSRGRRARARASTAGRSGCSSRFYERGLAYRKAAPVNWCPHDQTVVANEYVIDGRCERCGTPVELRNLEQWFFKITAYADELLTFDLPRAARWPERTMTIQRNWIGRSEGAEILFRIEELDIDIPVFTTRPDTLYGATFFVLAPEHPLVERIGRHEVRRVRRATAARRPRSAPPRTAKTGVFTGHYAINPVNGERLPDLGRRLRADGVRHRRDHGRARARRARPRVRRDVRPADRRGGHRGRHARRTPPSSTALPVRGREDGDRREAATREGRAAPAVSYRLRDWSFGRQRYWGCPIPIVYCDDCGDRARAGRPAAR